MISREEQELGLKLHEAKKAHGDKSVQAALVLYEWFQLKKDDSPKLTSDDVESLGLAYEHHMIDIRRTHGMESQEMRVFLTDLIEFAKKYGNAIARSVLAGTP